MDRWSICWLVSARLSVVGELVEQLGRLSVVGELLEHLTVGRCSVLAARWVGGGSVGGSVVDDLSVVGGFVICLTLGGH